MGISDLTVKANRLLPEREPGRKAFEELEKKLQESYPNSLRTAQTYFGRLAKILGDLRFAVTSLPVKGYLQTEEDLRERTKSLLQSSHAMANFECELENLEALLPQLKQEYLRLKESLG